MESVDVNGADRLARIGVIVAVIGVGLFGMVAGRSLFADGAYFLWVFLDSGAPLIFPERFMVQEVVQAPLSLAMTLGVSDIPTLVLAQGLGLIVIVAGMWALALGVLLRHRLFWPFVAIYAVIYLNGGLMSVGEFNLAYALVALSAAILLRDDRGPWHAVALLASAVILLRAFESLVFLGPLLIGLTVLALRSVDLSRAWRVTLWTAAALYALAALVSGWSILYPRDVTNRNNAADILGALATNHQLLLSGAAAAGFMVALAFFRGRWLTATLVVASILAAVPVVPLFWAKPGYHYEARVLLGLLLFLLLALAAVLVRRDQRLPGLTSLVPLTLLVALLVPFAFHTVGYARWLATFERVLAEGSGAITIANSDLAPGSEYYAWSWTHPFLSELLRPPGSDAVVQP